MKTQDLIGPALDWAVAKCEGIDVVILTVEEQRQRWFEYVDPAKLECEKEDFERHIFPTLKPIICVRGDEGFKRRPTHKEARMVWGQGIPTFAFSSSWAQGGPIIERERISIMATVSGEWGSRTTAFPPVYHYGPTPLIAAMRCYVSSKLGDEVDIPKELL